MSYTDKKITQEEINAHHVQGATDHLIGNAQQNKAVFDDLPEFIAGKHNELIDELNSHHGDEIKVAVDEWLAEHPEVTTTVQDNSLTTAKYVDGSVTEPKIAEGAVTPSKLDRAYSTPADLASVNANLTNELNVLDARMDEFASLPEGSTSGNAELVDIRVGANGIAYPSSGDAVRGQVADLKSDLSDETSARILLAGRVTTAESDIDTLETHKVAQPLDGNNQPTNGTSGQLLRTKGNGATEWSDVGLPTDEQTAQAVSDWLDAHPEATTTVQDGAITIEKINASFLNEIKNGYVTPEMFGAIGDGVTDDTTAIQRAINSNANVIIFTNSVYKCGKITVNHDCTIDCRNAEFICTDSILFDCVGAVADSYVGSNYSQWQKNYALGSGDNYTGMAMLKGTNNVFHARTYYYGGFVGKVVKDKLQGAYPIAVTGVTVEEINSIKVHISNIANVTFDNTNYSYVIRFYYNYGSVAEKINQKDSCYCVVGMESSLECIARNCQIVCLSYSGEVSYNYPIEIIDSSYCSVEHCDITNLVWHCVTTGGNYLCYFNTIRDCVLHSYEGSPAFLDHDNGLGTRIYNSEVSAILIGALCVIDGVDVTSCGGTYNRTDICLQATDDASIADYIIKNCKIIGVSGANADYTGIGFYISPQVVDSFEYQIRNVEIDNVICSGIALGRINRRGSTSLKVQNVSLKDVNMMMLFSCDNLYIKHLRKYDASRVPQIGGTGRTIGCLFVSDSYIGVIAGTINVVRLLNCITDGSTISNSNPQYNIVNSSIRFDKTVTKAGKVFAKNCIISGSATPYDIIGVNGVGYYGQYSANGYALNQIT